MVKHLEKGENLLDLIKEGAYLVDFYAEWCGPCKMLAPVLENITSIPIIKVDTDLHMQLATQYGIMSVPTLIFFRNGQEIKREIGFHTEEELNEIIASL